MCGIGVVGRLVGLGRVFVRIIVCGGVGSFIRGCVFRGVVR